MSKHTPGPWRLERESSHGYTTEVLSEYGESIASVGTHTASDGVWPEYPEGMANARLIAAAPDMLAALEDLVERCDGDAGVRADGSNIDTLRAHAAIAAARGEVDNG